ncbi:hypothetical protein JCM5350_003019 [Sporobolomyces pararoseus]
MLLHEFFNRFSLKQDDQLSDFPHPDFTFEQDGWSAAVALAEDVPDWENAKDDYGRICTILLQKKISPSRFAIESLVQWRNPGDGDENFSDWVAKDAESYWIAASRRQSRDRVAPQKRTFAKSYTDEAGTTNHISVIYQEPIALPFPVDENRHVHRTNDNKIVPQSAIFFASRFYKLRQLERRLNALDKSNPSHQKERGDIEEEVHSTLMSMILYYASAYADEDSSVPFTIDYESWKETYEHGPEYGSEIFGVKDGFGLNREFFERFLKNSSRWFKNAVEEWIPGRDTDSVQSRKAMEVVTKKMLDKLTEIFKESRGNSITSTSPLSPFVPRERGAFKEELRLRLIEQRKKRAEQRQEREARQASQRQVKPSSVSKR